MPFASNDPSATGQVFHPTFGQSVNYNLTQLPEDSDGQVAATIEVMRRLAQEDSRHPLIMDDAAQALREGNGCPITGVYRFIKNRLKFQQDEDIAGQLPEPFKAKNIIEVLIRPVDASILLRKGRVAVEDCDGFSTYAASLLLALGVPCNFCTVAVDRADPSRYSHVYLVAYPNPQDEGVPMDISHGEYPGWECPNPYGKRTEWGLSDSNVGLWSLVLILGIFVLELLTYRRSG